MEAKILKYDPDKPEESKKEKLKAIRLERNLWIKDLTQKDKHEKLFELEMLLKAVERYGAMKNHPIPDTVNLLERKFNGEMAILYDSIGKIILLTQGLLPPSVTSARHFTSYIGNRLIPDHARATFTTQIQKQASPEDGLSVLRANMIDIHNIMGNLIKLKSVSYGLFFHTMQIINREISSNIYFNPNRVSEFSPQSDRISNRKILTALRSITNPSLKKEITIVLLVLFRGIRCMQFVVEEAAGERALKANLIFFSLVHSELVMLVDHIENTIVKNHKRGASEGKDRKIETIHDTVDGVAYQISMELKKVMGHELSNVAGIKDIAKIRQGIARSKGVIADILKHSVVHIASSLDSRLKGKDIFDDFVSKQEISMRLRKDIWIFLKVVENVEETISQMEPSGNMKTIMEATKSMRNYIYYFQNTSYQVVRYTDREAFINFFAYVDKFNLDDINHRVKFEDFKRNLHYFKMYLETTLTNVENRSELKGKPFGASEGEQILEQFLA